MLTDALIKGLQPRTTRFKVGDQRGLFLLVTPNGSKLWRLKYSMHGIAKSPIALGAYPEVSLKRAREKQVEARQLIDRGIDPAAKRREEKQESKRRRDTAESDAFGAVAEEWFELLLSEKVKAKSPLAPSTAAHIAWRLNLASYRARKVRAPHVLNGWRERHIASLTKDDIANVIGGFKKRGKLETAHRTLHDLERVFQYAVGTKRMKSNPAREFSDSGDPRDLLPPVREKNHAALTSPREVGALLRAIDEYKGHVTTAFAFKLAPILFVRPIELRRACWDEFDLEQTSPAWRVPYIVMKQRREHIVPLPKQAVSLLNELNQITGPNGHLFPQLRNPKHPISENSITYALHDMGYKGRHTWHGFRTTASTLLREIGWDPELVERQLAHDVGTSTARAYDKSTLFPVRQQMMQAWADYLDTLRARSSS